MTSKWWIAGLACAVAWAQPSNQAGIAHVAFRVADLDAALAFYNKLGFEQFFAMKQGERTTEAFLKINDHQFLELYPRTSPAQPLGLMHACYESNDLEALHTEMAGRGLAVTDVRKAGAGNLLMTMKDPEGQTIEFTQYMPGSRHFEDRGRHLGPHRISERLLGAITTAHDPDALRAFYVGRMGFTEVAHDGAIRMRMPGTSGQELSIATGAEAKSGMQFGVADLNRTAAALKGFGMRVAHAGQALTVADPDGNQVVLVKEK